LHEARPNDDPWRCTVVPGTVSPVRDLFSACISGIQQAIGLISVRAAWANSIRQSSVRDLTSRVKRRDRVEPEPEPDFLCSGHGSNV